MAFMARSDHVAISVHHVYKASYLTLPFLPHPVRPVFLSEFTHTHTQWRETDVCRSPFARSTSSTAVTYRYRGARPSASSVRRLHGGIVGF
eukprot:4099084-Prymnesium_polylepis.1